MSNYLTGIGIVFSLEMRQRVRGVAAYVLLGIFVALVAIVTLLMTLIIGGWGVENNGGVIYSTIIYFVLLLGTLVTPALSGSAVNGDRDAGTLATTQVTLLTTGQLIFGKFIASWLTALAFLAVSLPFLAYSFLVGGITPAAGLVSILVLAFELGIVAAIGVGLSAVINRPLLSLVSTYLIVALLSIGTLIAFGLGGLAVQNEVVYRSVDAASYNEETGEPLNCGAETTSTSTVGRFDYFWGVLVANPYVLLADAVPTQFASDADYPSDLFGSIKVGVRSVQLAPDLAVTYNACEDWKKQQSGDFEYGFDGNGGPSAREILSSTVPGWLVGALLQGALAGGLLYWGYRRTRTPARALSAGSRVA